MRTLLLRDNNKKKVRGLQKKCHEMVQLITHATQEFPVEFANEKYWNYRLPVAQAFIDSSNTPRSVRRLCMQTLINRAVVLSQNKPKELTDACVGCLIYLPDLFCSEITIFFSERYFASFFDRNDQWQKWYPLSERDLSKEYHLQVPDHFGIRGYKTEFYDNDNPAILSCTGEIWFIGEV